MNTKVMFSRQKDEWSTPQDFFNELDREFGFTLDPCATDENHKCDLYYTKENDGLAQDWGGHIVFCNPPYSKVLQWAEKCYHEGQKEKTIVVLLVAARTDTKFFHEYIYNKSEIRFIRGRLKFGGSKTAAPFPSMLAIFRGRMKEGDKK